MSDDFEARLRERLRDLADADPVPASPNPAPRRVGGRRTTVLAVAAAVLVVLLVAAAFAMRRDPSGSTVRAAGPSTTAPSSATAGSSTTEATSTSTDGATSLPTSTTTGETTSTIGGAPDCTPADLAASIDSDKPSYAAGETVTMTVTIRNASDHTCVQREFFPKTFGSPLKITDAQGSLVWRRGERAVGQFVVEEPRRLAPGDRFTWTTVQWDQRFCQGPCAEDTFSSSGDEGGPVPPGRYGVAAADCCPLPAATTTAPGFEIS